MRKLKTIEYTGFRSSKQLPLNLENARKQSYDNGASQFGIQECQTLLFDNAMLKSM